MDAPRAVDVDEDALDDLGYEDTVDEDAVCWPDEPFTENFATGRLTPDQRPIRVPVTFHIPSDTDLATKYLREAMSKGEDRANEALWHACIQKPAWLSAQARRDHAGNVTQRGGYQKAPPTLRVILNKRLQEIIGVEEMNRFLVTRNPEMARSALRALTSTSPSPESEGSASEKPEGSPGRSETHSTSVASPSSNSNAPDAPSTPPTASPSPSAGTSKSSGPPTPTLG